MPKPKHRRKTGRKAVAHPGRNRPGRPLKAWLDDLLPKENAEPDVTGLPLFDWPDRSREHNISAPGSPKPWLTDC
jgi:hypothetical protein